MVADRQPMDANVVSDVAVAVIKSLDMGHLLQENGGKFRAGKSWCNTLLEECKLTRRKCTTQAQKVPENWRNLGHRLMLQVCNSNRLQSLPRLCVLKAPQLALHKLAMHVAAECKVKVV